MRKHVVILTVLITIGIGGLFLGGMYLGSRIRKTPAQSEQKHEHLQSPITRSPDILPLVSDVQEKKSDTAERKRGTVSTSTSGFINDFHQYAPPKNDGHSENGQASDSQPEKDEESVVLDEKMFIDENGEVTDWEKFCLARMHKHGWYKREDVPIVYAEPEGQPDGVYIWREDVNGGFGQPPREPLEYIKERNKELFEEQDRAVERNDAKKVIEIARELGELNRPYKGGVTRLHMGTCNIPPSWRPYFAVIWEAEKKALGQELQVIHQKLQMQNKN